MSKISLSILLMKDSITGFAGIVKDDVSNYVEIADVGRLYYSNSHIKPASSLIAFFVFSKASISISKIFFDA